MRYLFMLLLGVLAFFGLVNFVLIYYFHVAFISRVNRVDTQVERNSVWDSGQNRQMVKSQYGNERN